MVDVSSAEAARRWVDAYGRSDFGPLWSQLAPLCFNEYGWPVGVTHVSHFDALDPTPLGPETLDGLTIAYTYLATAFFCLDHLYDGESRNDFEALAIALLIPRAITKVAVAMARSGLDHEDAAGLTADLMLKFCDAMVHEKSAKSQMTLLDSHMERYHMVGRSSLVLYIYKIVAQIKGIPLDATAEHIFEDMIWVLQMGDDWGDWRQDYRSGNLTPFLRRCIRDMGRNAASEEELERFVYLSGIYEAEGKKIADGLRDIESRLSNHFGEPSRGLRAIVARCREQAEIVAGNFERIKSGLPPLPVSEPVH